MIAYTAENVAKINDIVDYVNVSALCCIGREISYLFGVKKMNPN